MMPLTPPHHHQLTPHPPTTQLPPPHHHQVGRCPPSPLATLRDALARPPPLHLDLLMARLGPGKPSAGINHNRWGTQNISDLYTISKENSIFGGIR